MIELFPHILLLLFDRKKQQKVSASLLYYLQIGSSERFQTFGVLAFDEPFLDVCPTQKSDL